MKAGELLVLVANGSRYVGVIEQIEQNSANEDSLYIPPRKKIKIIA